MTGRKLSGGSCIGGMKETQEMIDFVAKRNITADIEVIPIDYVNTAMERLVKADVRYRFVIDIGNTLKSSSCLLIGNAFLNTTTIGLIGFKVHLQHEHPNPMEAIVEAVGLVASVRF
nr:putative mannitol dehydrogenase [Quercus suber]